MRRLVTLLVVVLIASAHARAAGTGKEEARTAARRFGAALTASEASTLRAILPVEGKVHLVLVRLGPEEGFFGAGQVEAVFREALSQVVVRSFELLRLDSDEQTYALAHGRAVLTDRLGRPCRASFHLSFQPEKGTWVIREIKETQE